MLSATKSTQHTQLITFARRQRCQRCQRRVCVLVRAVRRPQNVITMRGMYRNVSPSFGAQPVRTVCDLQKQVLDVSQHCCYTHECVCVSVCHSLKIYSQLMIEMCAIVRIGSRVGGTVRHCHAVAFKRCNAIRFSSFQHHTWCTHTHTQTYIHTHTHTLLADALPAVAHV